MPPTAPEVFGRTSGRFAVPVLLPVVAFAARDVVAAGGRVVAAAGGRVTAELVLADAGTDVAPLFVAAGRLFAVVVAGGRFVVFSGAARVEAFTGVGATGVAAAAWDGPGTMAARRLLSACGARLSVGSGGVVVVV